MFKTADDRDKFMNNIEIYRQDIKVLMHDIESINRSIINAKKENTDDIKNDDEYTNNNTHNNDNNIHNNDNNIHNNDNNIHNNDNSIHNNDNNIHNNDNNIHTNDNNTHNTYSNNDQHSAVDVITPTVPAKNIIIGVIPNTNENYQHMLSYNKFVIAPKNHDLTNMNSSGDIQQIVQIDRPDHARHIDELMMRGAVANCIMDNYRELGICICTKCDAVIESNYGIEITMDDILHHIQQCNENGFSDGLGGLYICDLCGKEFYSKNTIDEHTQASHQYVDAYIQMDHNSQENQTNGNNQNIIENQYNRNPQYDHDSQDSQGNQDSQDSQDSENNESHDSESTMDYDSDDDYDNSTFSYRCPVCDRGYNDQIDLGNHFITRHNNYSDMSILSNQVRTDGFPGFDILIKINMIRYVLHDDYINLEDKSCLICCNNYDRAISSKTDIDISSDKASKTKKYQWEIDDVKTLYLENIGRADDRNPIRMLCCGVIFCSECIRNHIASRAGVPECPFCKKNHTVFNERYIIFDERPQSKIEMYPHPYNSNCVESNVNPRAEYSNSDNIEYDAYIEYDDYKESDITDENEISCNATNGENGVLDTLYLSNIIDNKCKLDNEDDSDTNIMDIITTDTEHTVLLHKYTGPELEWWKNSTIKHKGTYIDGKEEGEWTYFYDNGVKKANGVYVNGQMAGTWLFWYESGNKKATLIINNTININRYIGGYFTVWYENGQKKAEGACTKDKKQNGYWVTWHYKGLKKSEGQYNNGEPIGNWTKWYDNGKKESEMIEENCTLKTWYKNGMINTEGTITHGKKYGKWNHYYDNGNKSLEEIYDHNGTLNGKYITWHKNGELWTEGVMINGKKNGSWKSWYDNGQQFFDCEHDVMGNLIGKYTVWHMNGYIWAEGMYIGGNKIGEWKLWKDDGTLWNIENYEKGSIFECDACITQ